MKQYWQNLNDRERLLVIGCGFLIVLYLFYILIYSPLTTSVSEKRTELQQQSNTLTWMQQQKPQTSHQRQTITTNKLLPFIASQLSQGNLQKFVYQLQQTSSGDIQLGFESVPYLDFMNWLWALNNQYFLNIKLFSISRDKTEGLVKITIVFGQ